jgi:tRNA modification GTPase
VTGSEITRPQSLATERKRWDDRKTLVSDETITAVATPPGRGAVAIIRVSGAQAHEIVRSHVFPWPITARQATLCTVKDREGTVLDQALVTAFPSPRSFTGENMVEIATHGGGVVPALVMATLVGSGARRALPGEFTRRAVLNQKLDLVQAEAIGDLIDANSRAMHAMAVHQLDGGLSRRIAMLREKMIGLEALIAYDIDFPEEDDGPIPRDRIANAIRELLHMLNQLLVTAPAGELIRTGAVVVIAGAPNVGKSSLFNALLGADRAIVTDVPGTTRDAIEAVIDVGTWPVRLVDTAGLRETNDTVERLGIEVSTRYLQSADLILACDDTDPGVTNVTTTIVSITEAPVIGVRTKADVGQSRTPVRVSAATGDGIPTVLRAIEAALSARHGPLPVDTPVLTRERHRYVVGIARDEIIAFDQAWKEGQLPASIAAVHLRAAVHALEEMVGAIDVEDVLDRLFGTFCVGK